MAFELFINDALAHAGAGIALSLLDVVSAKMANPKAARLERKQRCLAAIEVLLDTDTPPRTERIGDTEDEAPKEDVFTVAKDSVEYADYVKAVRDYLRSSGLVKLQVPLFQKIKDGVRNLLLHEKINGLAKLQKLWVALGFEVLYAGFSGFLTQNFVAAVAAGLYRIPAFWLGLWLGNGIKSFINLIVTPKEEKKLDRTIEALLQETNIVEIIVQYQPPETVQRSLSDKGLEIYGSQLTRVGQGAFSQIRKLAESAKDTADDVLNYPQKQEEKHVQEQEERRKRFDELTKGR